MRQCRAKPGNFVTAMPDNCQDAEYLIDQYVSIPYTSVAKMIEDS